MSSISALIDIYKMSEISVDARIKTLRALGELINFEFAANITEPLVKELVALLNSSEAQCKWIPISQRLPIENGWYLTGLIGFMGKTYTTEVYFDAERIKPCWNNPVSDEIYCWLDGVPELPTPPEDK